MIQTCTQTQVSPDLKTRHWLSTLEPDQTIQLISTTDDCYRSDDECIDDEETDSMATSEATRVSAGSKRHANYTQQLLRNNILALEPNLEAYELDVTFSDEALRNAAAQLLAEHLHNVKEALNAMGACWDSAEYNGNEWQFHWMMHGQLVSIIDPLASQEHFHGWRDYEVTSPGNWNYGSKVLTENCKDLSQPKVDTCFSLAMHQDEIGPDTPLSRICRRVETRDYRSKDLTGLDIDVADFQRAAKLLSLSTLRRFNAHAQLKNVCFCPKTEIRAFGNYPISWYELKWSPDSMAVCVNQLGNGGIHQCGKQVDLITEAIQLNPDARTSLPKNVVCLGMCIAGKEWKVIVTASNAAAKFGTSFVYGEVCSGNWEADPEKFIGAVDCGTRA